MVNDNAIDVLGSCCHCTKREKVKGSWRRERDSERERERKKILKSNSHLGPEEERVHGNQEDGKEGQHPMQGNVPIKRNSELHLVSNHFD